MAPARRLLEDAIAGDSNAARCNPYWARAAAALKPVHTETYPKPNVRAGGDQARWPRPARAPANNRSMGEAEGAIIPTIITAHIANARKTLVHVMSMFIP